MNATCQSSRATYKIELPWLWNPRATFELVSASRGSRSVMCRDCSRGLDERQPTSMRHPSGEPVFEVAMALFGMVWLLRVRSEMRRCSKCRREELAAQQQQPNQQHGPQKRNPPGQTNQLDTPDAITSSVNTLFTVDTPGTSAPTTSYCEVHGYYPHKEGILRTQLYLSSFFFFFFSFRISAFYALIVKESLVLYGSN